MQAFVVQSRQLKKLSYAELVLALTENLRRMCTHPYAPEYAVAIAALALRIREEHLT